MKLTLSKKITKEGTFSPKNVFIIRAKVDLPSEQQQTIDKFGFGEKLLYTNREGQSDSLLGALAESIKALDVTANSLRYGQEIKANSIDEILGIEHAIKEGCQTLKLYLEACQGFAGEEVIEI